MFSRSGEQLSPMTINKDSITPVLQYLFLGASYFLICFHRNSLAVIGPRISTDFGLTTSSLGVVGSHFMYPYALMQVPSGLLADRVHPITVLRASVALVTLGAVLFATCSPYTSLCLSRLVLGLGSGLFYVPAAKLMSGRDASSSVGAMLGLFISVGNAGTIFASAPLTLLVMRWSWRTIVLLTGLLSGGLLLVSFGTHWGGFPKRTAAGQLRLDGMPASGLHYVISVYRKFSREIVILGLWSFFLVGAEISFRSVFAVDYLMKARGFAMDKAGVVLLAMTVGSSIGSPLVGWISDRFRPRKRVVLVFSLACVFWWAIQPLGFPYLGFIVPTTSYFIMGTICGCFIIAFAWAKEDLPEHLVGLTIGIFNLAGFLGSAMLSHILGNVAEGKLGYTGVFLINAIALLFSTLPVILVREPGTDL